ncbi:YihY/virulence factor BrkB family protein [Streptomyces sp. NPDC058045]|uniref:YihY/virulence factor BrkB family protein n=1 Tax=Streptomyces sp. NPDC058045 TaxID=3346311 RepID=UPI0036E416C7
MDWLKNLPVAGPLVERLMTTHLWRSYERLERVKWSRLAAAMTFISFVALFPLITVAAAVAAATLSSSGERRLEQKISEQVPGIAEQLDIQALVQNAGTVGAIAGAALLFTGIGWIGSMRECLRVVWELPEDPGNPILRKAKDAVVLLGLGGAGLASVVASALASSAVGWGADLLGLDEQGWGRAALRGVAFAAAVLADFLVLLYVLTLLPRVEPRRRQLITAAVLGAVGFELLKLLIGGYIKGIAARSMYGTFGVPVALLLWINFTARLLLFCAAWTAVPGRDAEEPEQDGETEPEPDGEPGQDAPPGGAGTGGAHRFRPGDGAAASGG